MDGPLRPDEAEKAANRQAPPHPPGLKHRQAVRQSLSFHHTHTPILKVVKAMKAIIVTHVH
jgi:hypothetical protein